MITPEFVLFGILAAVGVAASVGVVAFNSAIRSALCLVLNFFVLAVLYFTLNAQFLGITQVVVYTGAIMVLFLFVIMLLNIGAEHFLNEKFDYKRIVGLAAGVLLFLMVGSQLLPALQSFNHVSALGDYGTPQAIGHTLFTEYVIPFECISVLLLVGVVGSILLAKRKM